MPGNEYVPDDDTAPLAMPLIDERVLTFDAVTAAAGTLTRLEAMITDSPTHRDAVADKTVRVIDHQRLVVMTHLARVMRRHLDEARSLLGCKDERRIDSR